MKKSKRNVAKEKENEKLDGIRGGIEKAYKDYFEKATPFEISKRLCIAGISTSHTAGIFAILDRNYEHRMKPISTDSDLIKELTLGLYLEWKSEVDAKRREPDMNEMPNAMFMHSAAQYFTKKWFERMIAEKDKVLITLRRAVAEQRGDTISQEPA